MSTLTPKPANSTQREGETMGGFAKGLAIIELFTSPTTKITAAYAARETGITRAAAGRCLRTLEELGYVGRTVDQVFFPRPRLARLARGCQSPSLAEAAQPFLDALRDEAQEPAALTILDGLEAVICARAESSRIVTTGVRAGGHLPIYCSATGRILIGELPKTEQKRMLSSIGMHARTKKTLTSIGKVMAQIERASRQGVAYSDEEIEIGMRSMAVPIRSGDGRIRAALSLSTSSARVKLDEMKLRYLPILLKHRGILESSLMDSDLW